MKKFFYLIFGLVLTTMLAITSSARADLGGDYYRDILKGLVVDDEKILYSTSWKKGPAYIVQTGGRRDTFVKESYERGPDGGYQTLETEHVRGGLDLGQIANDQSSEGDNVIIIYIRTKNNEYAADDTPPEPTPPGETPPVVKSEWTNHGEKVISGVLVKMVQGPPTLGITWGIKWAALTPVSNPYLQITNYSHTGFEFPPGGHPLWDYFDQIRVRTNFPVDYSTERQTWDFKKY